jgi:hypothetical protein
MRSFLYFVGCSRALQSPSALAANDSGTELLIVEARYVMGTSEVVGVASWLALQDDGVSVLAQGELNEKLYAHHIVLAGDEALVSDYKGAARLRRTGSTVVDEAFHPMLESPDGRNPIIAHILAFDGRRAALSVHRWTPGAESQYSVEVLDASDLSTLASYDMSEEVQSVLVVGTELFGMNSAVAVATPYCP